MKARLLLQLFGCIYPVASVRPLISGSLLSGADNDPDRLKALLKPIIDNHFACMAAPIFKNGKVIASIGYYLPDLRLTEKTRPLLEAKLLEAVEKANKILG